MRHTRDSVLCEWGKESSIQNFHLLRVNPRISAKSITFPDGIQESFGRSTGDPRGIVMNNDTIKAWFTMKIRIASFISVQSTVESQAARTACVRRV